MKPRYVHNTIASRDRLTNALDICPAYMAPVIEAVRDCGIGLVLAPQGAGAFRIPAKLGRPVVIVIGDDLHSAHGPQGFHLPSIRRAIRQCHGFAVISSAGMLPVYAAAAGGAMMGLNIMIVETRPSHEIQWSNLIRKLAPDCPFLLSTVEGERH